MKSKNFDNKIQKSEELNRKLDFPVNKKTPLAHEKAIGEGGEEELDKWSFMKTTA